MQVWASSFKLYHSRDDVLATAVVDDRLHTLSLTEHFE